MTTRTYRTEPDYKGNSIVVTAATHKAAWAELAGLLAVDGPRALTATADDGAEIHASLYDGEDYIRTVDGRTIRSWA